MIPNLNLNYEILIEDKNKETTILAFSGLSRQNHLFDWMKSFSQTKVNFIAIKDKNNSWFLNQKEELQDYLRDLILKLGKKSYFIGGSMGGFAALYYGYKLNSDKILAFSPQSAAGEFRRALGDYRWPEDTSYEFDLSNLKFQNSQIHYGFTNKLDQLHSLRLEVDLKIGWNYSEHNLPHWLKDEGKLDKILKEFVC